MKHFGIPLLLTALMSIAATLPQDKIVVSDVKVRALPIPRTAAYFSMKNHGTKEVRLLQASSPDAKKIEIHRTVEADGSVHMESIDSIKIKPGETIQLKPMGLHLMIMGLKKPLSEGESISVILKFENHPNIALKATAKKSI